MTTGQQKRYFEFQDAKSAKFWEVTTDSTAVTVRYGKIGTNGQSQTKELADAAAAAKHVAKLVAEKTGKGYVELGQGAESQVASEPVPEATPAAPRKKSATANKAAVTNPAKDPEASPESLLALLNQDVTTNRLLARHPRASADLLEKLSHSSDKATRQAVTANPATPPDVYLRLGQQFPKEFLANPALDLLLMVNPALMSELPEALLVRLLKQAECPASLLAWAAGHPQAKVQLTVAMNANAPDQALEKLRASKHAEVLELVQDQPRTDPDQDPEKSFEHAVIDRLCSLEFRELEDSWQCGDIGLAQWIVLPLKFRLAKATNNASMFSNVIGKILTYTAWTMDNVRKALPDRDDWMKVAGDAKTPMAVLKSLASDPSEGVRFYVASNPSTPGNILELLSSDTGFNIRWKVAENPSTPNHVLSNLAKDKDPAVRRAVAKNNSTPSSVLESLAKKSNADIGLALIQNPSTPSHVREHVMQALSANKNLFTRLEVAKSSYIPSALLEVFAKDRDRDIRRQVAQSRQVTKDILETLSTDISNWVRRNVGENEDCPQDLIKVLASDPDEWVRGGVARNAKANPKILETLAKDSEIGVRQAVASNSSTPSEILENLLKDSEAMVRRGVAGNLKADGLLTELINDPDKWVREQIGKNSMAPAHVLVALSKDKDSDVRAAIAANRATLPEVLANLASDRVAGVVIEVARNPNTPLSTLISLTSTKNLSVREALASHAHRSSDLCRTLWEDVDSDVRLALLKNRDLDQKILDEIVQKAEFEREWVAALEHPNLSSESAQLLADKLLTTPATDSPWYRDELSRASAEVVAASEAGSVLSYLGKDPNKAVLAKRPMAPVMALCSAGSVETSRIVKVAGSTDWLVRSAVARNSGTPRNILMKLSNDVHPTVAQLAKINIIKLEATQFQP